MAALASTRQFPISHSALQIPHSLRYSQEQPSWPLWPPPANSPLHIPHSKSLTHCATRRSNPHGRSGLHPPIPHSTFRTPNSSLPVQHLRDVADAHPRLLPP